MVWGAAAGDRGTNEASHAAGSVAVGHLLVRRVGAHLVEQFQLVCPRRVEIDERAAQRRLLVGDHPPQAPQQRLGGSDRMRARVASHSRGREPASEPIACTTAMGAMHPNCSTSAARSLVAPQSSLNV